MKIKSQNELPLSDEGVPETTVLNAKRILDLMEANTSLPVMSQFLKSKDLHYSANSWDDLRENRIIPALRSGKVTLQDLHGQLAEVEEFGRCHTFLYSAPRHDVSRLLDRAHIESVCKKLGLMSALQDIIIEELPDRPKITQIREESANGHRAWVFKVVEKREEKTYVGQTTVGDMLRKEWKIGFVRAVNSAKLHDTGLLEIKIQSHISSTRYDSDVNGLWMLLSPFLSPVNKFVELSLRKAKFRLWEKRDRLKKKIRFCDSTMRNHIGSTIIASTGAETADLFEDSSIGPSLDQFLQHGAYCDSSNIWFRPVDGIITREIHVLPLGKSNEFAVTGSCTRNEYEYVLNELRLSNK